VTIVDELTRALPALQAAVSGLAPREDGELRRIAEGFDNPAHLARSLDRIRARLPGLDLAPPEGREAGPSRR
jgi:phosphopantothenate synthetase